MSPSGAEWERVFTLRLRAALERMRAGEDVPPALWFRAEGFAEAGIACGAIDRERLAQLIESEYLDVLGKTTQALFGEPAANWIDAAGGVRLRFRLPRAPVYPTTSA